MITKIKQQKQIIKDKSFKDGLSKIEFIIIEYSIKKSKY